MTIATKMIKPAFTALLLSAAPALAEGVPYAPCDYPGQYAHCPSTPTSNTNTNTNVAGAVAGAAAGAVSGSSSKATAKGGRGGNASSVSHGGAGGSAKATGGKAVANGGRQSQRSRTGDVRNVGNVNVEAVANAPTMDVGNSMMGSTSGSLLGAAFGHAKADVFPYMRQAGGDRIALAHLGNVHGPANKALRANGLAETAKERDARQIREARAQAMFSIYQPRMDQVSITVGGKVSYCKVIERHWNGVPSNIFATPAKSLPLCASYHGVDLK